MTTWRLLNVVPFSLRDFKYKYLKVHSLLMQPGLNETPLAVLHRTVLLHYYPVKLATSVMSVLPVGITVLIVTIQWPYPIQSAHMRQFLTDHLVTRISHAGEMRSCSLQDTRNFSHVVWVSMHKSGLILGFRRSKTP